jgi:hypothetical protein
VEHEPGGKGMRSWSLESELLLLCLVDDPLGGEDSRSIRWRVPTITSHVKNAREHTLFDWINSLSSCQVTWCSISHINSLIRTKWLRFLPPTVPAEPVSVKCTTYTS